MSFKSMVSLIEHDEYIYFGSLLLILGLGPQVDVAGKIWILPASGGKFKKSFHKKFSGRIAYCTILTINPLVNKSVNFPPLAGKIRILPAGSTFGFSQAACLVWLCWAVT